MRGGAGGAMRLPHLRHSCVVLAELVTCLCKLARRSAARIGPMERGRLLDVGDTSYPLLSLMVWSAPPTSSGTATSVEPRIAAECSAVDLPDGAGTAASGHHRPPPTRAERAAAKAHPLFCLVFTSARAPSSAATIL